MTVEFNNSAVSTQPTDTMVAEAPIDGQVEAPIDEVVEQAEVETENIGELPKGYKELQAEFTRKSQELAEIKKRYEKDATELATFRQLYTEQNKPQTPVISADKELSAKEFANLEPMEQLDYLVDKRIAKTVNPYIEEIKQLKGTLQGFVMENAVKARNSFFEKNPEALPYDNDLGMLMMKHNIADPMDAWRFLKTKLGLTEKEVKQDVLKEIQVKKDASKLMKPVSTPTTPTNTKVGSIEEAFEKSLKGLGIK